MALRVSIGAGRWRLVQMVLVESAILSGLAGGLGAIFAWRAAPLVLSMISSRDNPARLMLPPDWRVLSFGVVLIVGVMLLFGMLPAMRASAVELSALKGGDDPNARQRMMHGMIALQVAFCFLVLFMAGLFAKTFQRLSQIPLGYSPQGLLLLESVAPHGKFPQGWEEVADVLGQTWGGARCRVWMAADGVVVEQCGSCKRRAAQRGHGVLPSCVARLV